MKDVIERMQRDVRLKYLFAGEPKNNNYNKNLYIWWKERNTFEMY